MSDDQAYYAKEGARQELQSALASFIRAALAYGMDGDQIAREVEDCFFNEDHPEFRVTVDLE